MRGKNGKGNENVKAGLGQVTAGLRQVTASLRFVRDLSETALDLQ
jgi:hypothetical protein